MTIATNSHVLLQSLVHVLDGEVVSRAFFKDGEVVKDLSVGGVGVHSGGPVVC